jgi:hypothetical protein
MAPITMSDPFGVVGVDGVEEAEMGEVVVGAADVEVLEEALVPPLEQLARSPAARSVAVAAPANRVVVLVTSRMLPLSVTSAHLWCERYPSWLSPRSGGRRVETSPLLVLPA